MRAINSQAEDLNTDDEAVDVTRLDDGAILTVATRNSVYRLTLRDHERRIADVQGGSMFPEPTEATIEGSASAAGGFRIGIIQPGMSLALMADGRQVVTSKVAAVSVAA